MARKDQIGRRRKLEGGGLSGGTDLPETTYAFAWAWPYRAGCHCGSGSTPGTTWCRGYLRNKEYRIVPRPIPPFRRTDIIAGHRASLSPPARSYRRKAAASDAREVPECTWWGALLHCTSEAQGFAPAALLHILGGAKPITAALSHGSASGRCHRPPTGVTERPPSAPRRKKTQASLGAHLRSVGLIPYWTVVSREIWGI